MNTNENLLFSGFEPILSPCAALPVTRRKALLHAAFLLGNSAKNAQIVAAIRGAAEIPPIVKWGAETIKDCIANYYYENKKYPCVSDLGLFNRLPPPEAIKYVFGVSAGKWLEEYRRFVVGFGDCAKLGGDRLGCSDRLGGSDKLGCSDRLGGARLGSARGKSAKNIVGVTRMQALRVAESVLEGEERERVREMIEEYPIAEWNERNIADILLTFYEKYGRVPSEREMKNSCELPYYGIFRYRFGMSYRAFLKERLPALYEVLRRSVRAEKAGAAEKHGLDRADGGLQSLQREENGEAKSDGAAENDGAETGKNANFAKIERAGKNRTAGKSGSAGKNGSTGKSEKPGKIKSIKIIRVDFGGSIFYPTCSNVEEHYFWEEEKKCKDTFIRDYFLQKKAREEALNGANGANKSSSADKLPGLAMLELWDEAEQYARKTRK